MRIVDGPSRARSRTRVSEKRIRKSPGANTETCIAVRDTWNCMDAATETSWTVKLAQLPRTVMMTAWRSKSSSAAASSGDHGMDAVMERGRMETSSTRLSMLVGEGGRVAANEGGGEGD